MENKEIALQLAKAAIAGGAVKFTTDGTEDEMNKANAEKIISFYKCVYAQLCPPLSEEQMKKSFQVNTY